MALAHALPDARSVPARVNRLPGSAEGLRGDLGGRCALGLSTLGQLLSQLRVESNGWLQMVRGGRGGSTTLSQYGRLARPPLCRAPPGAGVTPRLVSLRYVRPGAESVGTTLTGRDERELARLDVRDLKQVVGCNEDALPF